MYPLGASSAHSGAGAFYSSSGERQLSPPVTALGRQDTSLEAGDRRRQAAASRPSLCCGPRGFEPVPAQAGLAFSANSLQVSVKKAPDKEAGLGKSENLRKQGGK